MGLYSPKGDANPLSIGSRNKGLYYTSKFRPESMFKLIRICSYDVYAKKVADKNLKQANVNTGYAYFEK